MLLAALGILLSAGCEASRTNAACERLQDFSCHCFPLCELKYNSIIDSQDSQACDKALSDAYDEWKGCQGTCTPNCEYGWGSCALSHYRAVGKNPSQPCPAGGTDAGSDGN